MFQGGLRLPLGPPSVAGGRALNTNFSDMDWQLAREYRPSPQPRPRPLRKPWKLGRWSSLAAALAWLLPIMLLCAQVASHSRDGAFQEAPRHNADWLVARVGQPQRVVRYNSAYRIWCYPRGNYQVEVAINERNQICGVAYGRLPR